MRPEQVARIAARARREEVPFVDVEPQVATDHEEQRESDALDAEERPQGGAPPARFHVGVPRFVQPFTGFVRCAHGRVELSSANRSQPAGGGASRQNCSGAGAASLALMAQSASSARSCDG